MANVLAPFGFTPVRRLDGAAWTGNQSQYKIKSDNTTHFYQGDCVTLLSTGYIDKFSAGATALIGVFVGCEYLSTAGSRRIWSNQFPGADTAADVIAYVVDDPNVVFMAQAFNTSTAAVPVTALGANSGIVTSVAGSNLNGISGQCLDDNSPDTTTTKQWRIVGIPGLTDVVTGVPYLNANGYDQASPYNFVLVAPNNHLFRGVSGI